jgi:2-dehydropantoate 2-reductase
MMSQSLRIGIVGAGAIGMALAGRLALAGQPVSIVARGPRREAILKDGVRLCEAGATRTAFPAVIELAELATADLIIVSVKTPSLPDLLPQIASVMAPSAVLMPAVNGLPWWYFQGDGRFAGTALRSVDPTGGLSKLFDPERLIGCVVYSRAAIGVDGEVIVQSEQRLRIGRVTPGPPPQTIADRLRAAGIVVSIEQNIRREVWRKLVRNASTNLVSGLTGATLEEIGRDPGLLEVVRDIAIEVIRLSEHVGSAAEVDIQEIIGEIKSAGPFATSMLQDIRAGRPPELDALAEAPIEMANLLQCPMPTLRHVSSLLRARLRCG